MGQSNTKVLYLSARCLGLKGFVNTVRTGSFIINCYSRCERSKKKKRAALRPTVGFQMVPLHHQQIRQSCLLARNPTSHGTDR